MKYVTGFKPTAWPFEAVSVKPLANDERLCPICHPATFVPGLPPNLVGIDWDGTLTARDHS